MSDHDPYANTVSTKELAGLAATLTSALPSTGAAATADSLPVGSARFERGDELGRGGMGVVFSATDRQFNREVALKQLRHNVRDEASIDRFATECLITGNLSHPGIPAVYERGDIAGSPFYAMQRVQGRTLKEALEAAESLEQRLTLIPALGRVAQTLAYAHSSGVVHRDIKPSNIVVGDYGETFVLDWGIAKVRGITADSSTASTSGQDSKHSTRIGQVIGTPAYMAPEQAAGRINAIDERTDVFALGALLYHVLVGRPPYDRGSAEQAVDNASRGAFESIHQAAPKAPKALRLICERAMALQPGDRFRSAADVAAALARFTSEAVAHQDTGPVGWIARGLTVLTALLALAGVAVVAQAVPMFLAAGHTAIGSAVLAALGLSLSILEYATRGTYRLNPFILVIAGCTFVSGVVGTTTGLHMVYNHALAGFDDVERFRHVLVEGTREAIGAMTIAGLLTMSQLLAWAIARRRASMT